VSDRTAAVEAYKSALIHPDATSVAAVRDLLSDDIVVVTNFGGAEGVEAAVAFLSEPRTAGFAAAAHWSEPTEQGDSVAITAALPPSMPVGGLELVFDFAGPKIVRVEQQMLPAAPLEPVPLRLTEEINEAINAALDNQTPMLIAYRDDREQIHLSFRGTVQSYSDDQLALWARDPQAGLPRNITAHPHVTLFYHDPASRTTYNFYGRARVETDAAARSRIFDASNRREQQMDFRRRGVAIVVDVDRVDGRGPSGRVLMTRTAPTES
jgi:Pyridoxamine 5'-phosphate oxidase